MGDRTTYTIDVGTCPPEVLAYVGRKLHEDYEAEAQSDDTWSIWEWSIGATDAMYEDLLRYGVEVDHPFPFRIWEDPRYEYLGIFEGFIPTLDGGEGASATCSSNSEILLDDQDVEKAITTWRAWDDGDAEALVARLQWMIGYDWNRLWEEANSVAGG